MNQTIGEKAGMVWKYLSKEKSPVTLTNLKKNIKGTSESELHYALGWLAREEKVNIYKENRTTYVRLNTT